MVGHKRVRYLFDVRAQRALFRSRYAFQPSRLLWQGLQIFSTFLLNDK